MRFVYVPEERYSRYLPTYTRTHYHVVCVVSCECRLASMSRKNISGMSFI